MKKIIILTIFSLIFLPLAVFAEEIEVSKEPEVIRPSVRILNSKNFQLEKEFYPFAQDSTVEGLNITIADLDGDGFKEIIVAAGRNEKPLVKIFNHKAEFDFEFLAYADNYQKGVKVVVADLYNDGQPEFITAPEKGGGPHIRIYNNQGVEYFGFFAFDKDLRGGANLSVGDVNGNSQKEIIVGAGYGMEPVVRIFDNYSNLIKEFLVYEKEFRGGVNVLAADLDNDSIDEIIVAPAIGKEPRVKIFDFEGNLIKEFIAYPYSFWGGVNLAKSDIDQDGFLEILTGAGFSGGAHLRFFDAQGEPKINPKLFVYDDFKGGISIAGGDLNNDGQIEILAATQTISPINKYKFYKIIEIDLNKQTLYTYSKGSLDKEYLISSGTWKYPTPKGNFKIYAKIPSMRMSWFYGPDNPDNYDLSDVPWDLLYYGNYIIHGTYWHNNFGHRMSHGCINMSVPDAKEVYDWADIGVPVNIYNSKT